MGLEVLSFGLTLQLYHYFVYGSREGSGESAQMYILFFQYKL